MDTTVEDIYVQGLTGSVTGGRPTAMALLIENMTPRGVVRGVILKDVHIAKTNALSHGFKIAGVGALTDVSIQDSSFTGTCTEAALHITGASNVEVARSTFVASPGCKLAVFVGRGAMGVTFRQNRISGKSIGGGD